MLKIKIKETGLIYDLSIIDPKTGVDWISDFIGNHDGFREGEFEKPADTDANYDYEIDQGHFNWWETVINDNEALDYRIHDLNQEHGWETIQNIVWKAYDGADLEYQASMVNQVLDEFEAELEAELEAD